MTRNRALSLAALILLLTVPAVRPEPIPLTGRVTDSAERPATVRLELTSLAGPQEKTPAPLPAVNARGELRVNAPGAGFWRLTAQAPGTAAAALDLLPLVEPATLPPLHLVPARRLRIVVTDPVGRPLPGAVVRIDAVPDDPGDHARGWSPAPSLASTGQNGSALLDVSPSSPLLLSVIASGFLPDRREVGAERDMVVRLRPGVTRIVEARSPQGRAVSGVAVVTEIGLHLGTTDGEGRLPVTVPATGETRLRLLAADCLWAEGALRSDSPGLFTLQPPRPLRGRVLDHQTRQPLAGAWVWREGLPSCSARTDAEGRYALALPGFGAGRLQGSAPGYQSAALALGDAQGTEIPPLALLPAVGRPSPDRLTLSGRVVDPAGDPLAGAQVQALPAAGSMPGDKGHTGRQAVTSGDGRFLLCGFAEGEAPALRFEAEGFAARTLPGVRVPLAEPLTVVLSSAARLSGTVMDESGDPIGGARLVLAEDLREGDAQGRRGRPVSAGEADAEGRFELSGLAPGSFRLVALNAGYLPETRDGIDLRDGERIAGVDIVLRRGATIEGTVSAPDGSPAAGAKVLILDPGEDLGLGLAGRPTAVADAGGRYEIAGVSEGERTVLAELAGFQPARERLRVEAGANRLDLRLSEGFEISGRVSGPEGPVAGAVLRLVPRDDGSTAPPPPGATSPEGRFRFVAVAEGSYRIEVEKHGYTMADPSLDVRIAGAPVQDLEVRLERGATIAGRILGLVPEDLSQVRIVATSSGHPGRAGQATPDGRYRIEGVGPGPWTVLAALPRGNQTGGTVLLAAGQAEAVLDLEFTTGFVLSGRVEHNGEAVGGAVVLVEGEEGGGGNVVTAPDGGFRLDGLRPGTYGVTALDTRSQGRLDLRIEIEGDREIVLRLPEPPREAAPPLTVGRSVGTGWQEAESVVEGGESRIRYRW